MEVDYSSSNLKLKVNWFTHPFTIGSFILAMIIIGFAGGTVAYLGIAIIQIVLLFFHARYAPISGVLWLLGLSTVLGFFQRLSLYSAGQNANFDYIRFALEISVLLYAGKAFLGWKYIPKHNRWAKLIDLEVGAYLVWSSLYAFNVIYAPPLVTIYGWRWVCIPILMYFIGRIIGARNSNLHFVNKVLIILLLVQSLYGVFQAVVGFPFFEQPWIAQLSEREKAVGEVEGSMFIAGQPRIPALTEGHTSGGLLIPYLFLWVLFLPRQHLIKRFRRLQWLAVAASILFLAVANERSAVGMVLVGIGIAFFLRWRRKLGRPIFLFLFPALALLVLLLSQVDPTQIPWQQDTIVIRRLAELANPFRSGTLAGRLAVYWPQMWVKFLNNPFGYGLGTFHDTSANRIQLNPVGSSPHNMYIQIALEVGVIGLSIFMAWLVTYVRLLYKTYIIRFSAVKNSMILSAVTSLAAFLAIGFANQPIETFSLAVLFWFLIGITTSHLANYLAEMC